MAKGSPLAGRDPESRQKVGQHPGWCLPAAADLYG